MRRDWGEYNGTPVVVEDDETYAPIVLRDVSAGHTDPGAWLHHGSYDSNDWTGMSDPFTSWLELPGGVYDIEQQVSLTNTGTDQLSEAGTLEVGLQPIDVNLNDEGWGGELYWKSISLEPPWALYSGTPGTSGEWRAHWSYALRVSQKGLKVGPTARNSGDGPAYINSYNLFVSRIGRL